MPFLSADRRFYMEKLAQETGAVAGNVKVGNEINMITKWQSIEYITSQNFDRRAFGYLNCITVIPNEIGAFRRKAVIEAGGFTTDTLAEDCDLTMRGCTKQVTLSLIVIMPFLSLKHQKQLVNF
jgi:cellulose synthase/poly-beta-1,6-N-acetylglucosamine synthase-like glycosyltransferase